MKKGSELCYGPANRDSLAFSSKAPKFFSIRRTSLDRWDIKLIAARAKAQLLTMHMGIGHILFARQGNAKAAVRVATLFSREPSLSSRSPLSPSVDETTQPPYYGVAPHLPFFLFVLVCTSSPFTCGGIPAICSQLPLALLFLISKNKQTHTSQQLDSFHVERITIGLFLPTAIPYFSFSHTGTTSIPLCKNFPYSDIILLPLFLAFFFFAKRGIFF